MYHFMTGGYHDSAFTALMTVSRLPYIVILIHDLLHAHYEYAIMDYCIFMEWMMFESWILNICAAQLMIILFDYLQCFLQLYDWCLCNKLMKNQDKTKCVLFHMPNKPIPCDCCALNVGAVDIVRVKEVTFLGVILDEKRNWRKQIENIYKSLLQFFGIFNHIKSFVSKHITSWLYFACIY